MHTKVEKCFVAAPCPEQCEWSPYLDHAVVTMIPVQVYLSSVACLCFAQPNRWWSIHICVQTECSWDTLEFHVNVASVSHWWEGNLKPLLFEIRNWAVAAHLSKTGNFMFPLLLIATACITLLLHMFTHARTHTHTRTYTNATRMQPQFYITVH